jgi:hypothetical protein
LRLREECEQQEEVLQTRSDSLIAKQMKNVHKT